MIELEVSGDVRILHMRDGENRFNPGLVTAMHVGFFLGAAVIAATLLTRRPVLRPVPVSAAPPAALPSTPVTPVVEGGAA
jgi:hypothetical protein